MTVQYLSQDLSTPTLRECPTQASTASILTTLASYEARTT